MDRRAALLGRAHALVHGQVREIVAEARPDTRGLSGESRLVVILGYVAVFAVMASATVFELFGSRLPSVSYEYAELVLAAPSGSVEVSAAIFVVGWSLVLTGATDCGWRLFVPLLLLFAFDMFLLAAEASRGAAPGLGLQPFAVEAAILLTAAVFQVATRRSPSLRERPLVELLAWTVVLVGFELLLVSHASEARWQRAMLSRPMVHAVLLIPVWLLFGLESARMGVSLGAWLTARLRRLVGDGGFRHVAGVTILVPATVHGLVWHLHPPSRPPLGLDEPVPMLLGVSFSSAPFLLIGWGIWRLVRGRWTTGAAATGLALATGSLVLLAAFAMAAETGQDFVAFALAAPGLVSPVFLYVVLMTYNVLAFGAKHASSDGATAPRTGRMLVYLGVVMLALGAVLLPATQRVAGTGGENPGAQTFVDSVVALGLASLGPGYLIWTAWRRRDRLIGPAGLT